MQSLRPGEVTPEVFLCPDGHFQRIIWGIGPYIADYPEQVLLACIVEVFNSTIATFRAPSDISGVTGMHHEHIWATPSWRNGPAHYETVLINSNPDIVGIYGFEIARTLLFFAFWHQERHYPCALVHWFSFVGVEPDEDTGFSTVEPDFTDDGSPRLAIVHIDAIYRAVHLLAAHQNAQFINHAFTMHSTLDKFKLFYVNKYADHHAFDSLR